MAEECPLPEAEPCATVVVESQTQHSPDNQLGNESVQEGLGDRGIEGSGDKELLRQPWAPALRYL